VFSKLGTEALSLTEPHNEFLELCAVSTSGQLTEGEKKKLQERRQALPLHDTIKSGSATGAGIAAELRGDPKL
jgi:hypothetical protein